LADIAKVYVEAFNAHPWNDKWTVELVVKRLSQMMNCEGFMESFVSLMNKFVA
jgi:hypothetical protein